MAIKRWDRNGIQLADVPGSGVSNVDPNAKSGNPRHDSRSGKFGAGGVKKPTTPANVSPDAYARMWDAARAAARTLKPDAPDEALKKFLAGRSTSPEMVDLQAFGQLVTQQRQNDLVDTIAADIAGGGARVRVTVPVGWVKKQLSIAPDAGTVSQIMARVVAQGVDADAAKRYFKTKVGDVADEAHAKVTAVAASDQPEWPTLLEDDGVVTVAPPPPDPAKIAASIAQNMPQPHIEVTVPITVPERGPMTIKRNAETGLIEEVG